MKQITIKGKAEFLLVEVPDDTFSCDFSQNTLIVHTQMTDISEDIEVSIDKGTPLGLYNTQSNTIDFEVKEEWVKILVDILPGKDGILRTPGIKLYQNYKYDLPQPVDFTCVTAKESFLSLLKSETERAFPLKVNPYDKVQNVMYHKGQQESVKIVIEGYERTRLENEAKVMPTTFAVILIK